MKSIGEFTDKSEFLQRSTGSESRMIPSARLLRAEQVERLGLLMAQAQAYFPNQVLPEGTPDVYLEAWEELAAEFGMEMFRQGLWRALRRGEFFPVPAR